MNLQEAKIIVEEINAFIKKELWFDFEIKQYVGNDLTLYGGLSLTYPNLEIKFTDVFFVSFPMEWQTDTKGTVMSVIEGEDDRFVNERFKAEYFHLIFKFTPEHNSSDCLIAAKQVSYKFL